jgi:pimeloyl-ACP methyl ester carboxylesterase
VINRSVVGTGTMREPHERLLFLSGASGNTQFWAPAAKQLRHPGSHRFLAWPGFGGVPLEPGVRGIADLVSRVVGQIEGPTALIAQSMGGVVAVRAALEKPDLVRHLVLTATSGGIDIARLGARDWRPMYRERHPDLPSWFLDEREDLTERIREIRVPVLLLWGDADPISPVAVGRRLAELFSRAELVVFPGGTHDLALERAAEIAPHIDRHLAP